MSTQAPSLASSRAVVVAELVDQLIARVKVGEPDAVEALLAEHPEHADDLRRLLPAVQMMADLSRSGDARSARAVCGGAAHEVSGAPGQPLGELGDYRIIREVGRGGMGVVYEAEQVSLGRRVALKVLPYAGALDAKQLQRFKNEAKAAASLRHDHIVQVHAIGCERGVHFYAMEFIDGQTLAQVIAGRTSNSPPSPGFAGEGPGMRAGLEQPTAPSPLTPLPQSRERGTKHTAPVAALSTKDDHRSSSLSLSYRTTAALIADAADALEHAHSLGIVHRDVKPGNLLLDADGRLYVSDFGLARFGTDAGLTMTGDLLGTLRYMAPEQALAKHGLADHRADVYGLGCTLYELLTGKPAVGGEDKADILRRIVFEEPVAPRKLDKAIPAELETIALKCLAKEPRERYASAGELAADLRRFLQDKPIKARPPGVRERAVRWVRRHRALTASTAVALLAAALMLAGSIGFFARERANRLALAQRTAAAALAAAQMAVEADDLVLAGRQVAEARGQIGGDRDGLPDLAAAIDSVQQDIDSRQLDASRFQRFIRLTTDAQDRMGFNREYEGDRVGREALAIYGVLDADDWLAGMRNSTLTEAQKRKVQEAAYVTVVSLADFGTRWVEEQGPESARRGLDLLRRAKFFHEPTRAFYFVRSECYHELGDRAAADADAKRFEAAPAQTSWDHYLPGRTTQTKDDLDGAIRSYRAALTMQPNHYNALFFLAQSLERKKEYAEAIGLFSACLALGPAQGQPDVFAHRSYCYRQLGKVEAAHADYTAAMTVNRDSVMCQRALAHALHDHGRFDDELVVNRRFAALDPESANALGCELCNRRQYAEAAKWLRRAIDMKPNNAAIHSNLGHALEEQGNPEAEMWFRKALELEPNSSETHKALAICLARQRKDAEADIHYRRAIELLPNASNINCFAVFLDSRWRRPEAEAEYRRAIQLSPNEALLHGNLANCLAAQKKTLEAEAAFRRAVSIAPHDDESVHYYYGLGNVLLELERHVEAANAFRATIQLKKDTANDGLHRSLGLALLYAGQYPEAVAAYRKNLDLFPDDKKGRADLQLAERFAQLDPKLAAILAGDIELTDAAEMVEVALLFKYQRKFATAARFYAAAFAAEPELLAASETIVTYSAAHAATMAACGRGLDAASLDAAARSQLRQQALAWFTARLAGKAKLAKAPEKRRPVANDMRIWLGTPDLAGFRDNDSLAGLPNEERIAWLRFWAEVAALKNRCEEPQAPEKPPPKP